MHGRMNPLRVMWEALQETHTEMARHFTRQKICFEASLPGVKIKCHISPTLVQIYSELKETSDKLCDAEIEGCRPYEIAPVVLLSRFLEQAFSRSLVG